jgi:hypothetical protein
MLPTAAPGAGTDVTRRRKGPDWREWPDGFVEAVQQGGAAALSAAMDPVAAGDAEGCDGQFYYQVQPQVFGVQQELVGEALDHLALDPVPVVLDVF